MRLRNPNYVLTGYQSQIRVPVRKGEEAHIISQGVPSVVAPSAELYLAAVITAVYRKGRLAWGVGRDYAVQPSDGGRALGRFLITGIRCEALGDICYTDLRSMGPPRQHKKRSTVFYRRWYQGYWDERYAGTEFVFSKNPLVWVLHVKPLEESKWRNSGTH